MVDGILFHWPNPTEKGGVHYDADYDSRTEYTICRLWVDPKRVAEDICDISCSLCLSALKVYETWGKDWVENR